METNPILQNAIDRLNPMQREATLHLAGPELIIAGAGSGKTSVITTRIAYLIELGVLPERILALTFTRKASSEMKKRINSLIGENAGRVTMGTFHSVLATILRTYAPRIGYPSNFSILDEDDSLAVFRRAAKAVVDRKYMPEKIETEEERVTYEEEVKKYQKKQLRDALSNLKNKNISPNDYDRLPDARKHFRTPLLGEIYHEYARMCREGHAMDYDDILMIFCRMLEASAEIRSTIGSYFDYILIDEYQDTNRLQYAIMSHLTEKNKNICVVGDDSQSIYAFRGADINNILSFSREFPDTKVIRLERNYRSTGYIIEAANNLISHNRNRLEKNCYTENGAGEEPELITCRSDLDEAYNIFSIIKAEMNNNPSLKYSDIAVLVRTNAQTRCIEDRLINERVPYVIYSGTSFYGRTEIKNQTAYFRLAVNPDDNEALRRVINEPARGIGKKAMEKIAEHARTYGKTLWRVISDKDVYSMGLNAKTQKGLSAFEELINICTASAREKNAYEAAVEITGICGLLDNYTGEGTEETLERADNIRELLDAVFSYSTDAKNQASDLEIAQSPDTLDGFIQNMMLLSNADTKNDGADMVNIMTVHCAKGLEFDTVLMAGMEEELFPLTIERTRFEEEEERRLCYVAMTRAKRKLYLLNAERRARYGMIKEMKPSHFLTEMEKPYNPEDTDEDMNE